MMLVNVKQGIIPKILKILISINLIMLSFSFTLWVTDILEGVSAYYIDVYPDRSSEPTVTVLARRVIKDNETYIIFNKPVIFVFHNSSNELSYVKSVLLRSFIPLVTWLTNICVVVIAWRYYKFFKRTER